MTLQDLVREAANAYEATGLAEAMGLKPHLLASLDHPVDTEPSQVVALEQLGDATGAGDAQPIAQHVGALADRMRWLTASAMQELAATRDRHAYVELVGPKGAFASEDVRLGLYFQSAGTVYPSHHHAAEELYLVLSGTAEWQKDDAPFARVAPGTLIHHLSFQPHATTTLDEPMLAMWAWLGDISPDSYTVDGVPGL